MPHFSKQTKSFLFLLLVAFTLVMSAHYLLRSLSQNQDSKLSPNYNQTSGQGVQDEIDGKASVDTKDWINYTHKASGLSFKYPKQWGLKTYKEVGDDKVYHIISLDPGKKSDKISIYIGDDGYYAMAGLPTKPTQIAGLDAVTADELLYGVKHQSTYVTFDLGGDITHKPEFKTLVNQIAFVK